MTILTAALNSVSVVRVSYDVENLELTLTFRNGAVYRYSDVEFDVYDGLIHSDSAGRFVVDNITQHYNYEVLLVDNNWYTPVVHNFQSEFLESGTYHNGVATLTVNGRVYDYDMLPEVWEQFIQSQSAGSYFNNFIRSTATPAIAA